MELTAVCYKYDEEGESPIHPADVTSWECVDGVSSSSFLVTCNPGCDGSESPSPTPSPTPGLGGVASPSSTPSPTDAKPREVDSSQSSSPLDKAEVWVGIVGGVVGTAAILVGVVRYFWKKRRGPQP